MHGGDRGRDAAPRGTTAEPLADGRDLTVDSLLGGALHVIQHRRGSRFGIDALLLAGAARCAPKTRVVDLGCGNGVVALAMAHLWKLHHVVGLEIQPRLAELARDNVARNGFSERIRILVGDVRHIRDALQPQSFDMVVCNPPYYPARQGRINPDVERAAARHELHGRLADFLAAAHYALIQGGVFQVIYPASRLIPLLAGLGEAGLKVVWIQFVQPAPGRNAQLVLCRARRGGAPSLVVRPPLLVTEGGPDGDSYSPVVARLLAGDRPHYPGEVTDQ